MAYIYHYYAVIEGPGDGRATAEGLYRIPYPLGMFSDDYSEFRRSIKWPDSPAWIQERQERMEVRSLTFLGQTDDGYG